MKKFLIFLLSAAVIIGIKIDPIKAQAVAESNNIFISINNTLFNFDGPAGVLANANFGKNTMQFVAPPGLLLAISTLEDKNLAVSPAQFSRIACKEKNNVITIDTSKAVSPIAFTISVQEGICHPTGSSFINTLEEIRSSPVTQKIVREIVIPISITVTTVSAGTLLVNASVGSASFAFNITQLLQQLGILRFYALGLLRFRRKKPWGKVTEESSGRPLRGVLVQIYEAEFKKIKDAQLTDNDGRFSAVMTPGRYYIKASKNGFETQEIGSITVNAADTILDLEITLSPVSGEIKASYIKHLNLIHAIKKFLDTINPYLLILGTLISLGAVLLIPTTINYLGFIIYLCLDVLKIYFAKSYIKPFGLVTSTENQTPIPLAVVRIFDNEKQFLLSTKVTDNEGHFGFLLSPGKYYLTCAKAGYKVFKSPEIMLRKSGLATLDIKMEPTKY